MKPKKPKASIWTDLGREFLKLPKFPNAREMIAKALVASTKTFGRDIGS
jgi:hypothetical protein